MKHLTTDNAGRARPKVGYVDAPAFVAHRQVMGKQGGCEASVGYPKGGKMEPNKRKS